MMELARVLFPHLSGVRVERVFCRGVSVRIEAAATAPQATCPGCATVSHRVHSRYQRRLADACLGRREIEIQLTVRRFFCREPSCPRKTFAEQVEAVTTRHGRRTQVADRTVLDIGLALGGRAGARLIAKIGTSVSRMTLLRVVRVAPSPARATPRVLGVDDFALRRGHRYGTILIDMDTHRPVDVLEDRTADTLAAWLKAHPGVEIVCRDRAGAYAEAVTRSAPAAVQVADRWQLLHNLSEAVEKAVARHRRCLQPPPEPAPPAPSPPVPAQPPPNQLAIRTRARHADVHALASQGLGPHQISKRLHLDPKTVRRFLAAADVEQLLGPRAKSTSVLDRYKPYLLERCQQGVAGTTTLLTEITARGYRGGERTLRRWLIGVRGTEPAVPTPPPPPSARQITAWIMRPADKLTADDRAGLADALARCPDIAAVADLAGQFAQIVRHLHGKDLHQWLAQADSADFPELRSFANGMRKDLDAVMAGLTLTWSSGAVEGNVNRIKMIKRQMYGRAKFDLLRKRILAET